MKIASLVARILLGLIMLAAGLSGFIIFHNPPPAPPGLAAAFQDAFFRSGWVLVVDAVELACGLLLLFNRFVPLAVVALAALIVNMYAFHLTMMPIGTIAPVILTILWFTTAWPLRAHFAPLLTARAEPDYDTHYSGRSTERATS